MEKITVLQAAKKLNVDPQFLRVALQHMVFDWGVAVKRGRWTYYINPVKFNEYIGGENNKRNTAT